MGPLVLASLTDPLVRFATNVVGDLGLGGVFVLMLLESACVPIPSEATMLLAGFNVHNGDYSLLAITVLGVAGNLIGSWIAYAVGYYGRLELLERHGRVLHVKPEHLAWADRWFERYGAATVFFTRMLPIVRTFISLPAGVAPGRPAPSRPPPPAARRRSSPACPDAAPPAPPPAAPPRPPAAR